MTLVQLEEDIQVIYDSLGHTLAACKASDPCRKSIEHARDYLKKLRERVLAEGVLAAGGEECRHVSSIDNICADCGARLSCQHDAGTRGGICEICGDEL